MRTDLVLHGRAKLVALGACLLMLGFAVAPTVAAAAATPQEEHGGEQPAEGAQATQQPDAGAEHEAAEEHGDEEHAGPSWTEYVYKWINFGLLIGLLYWLLVVPPAFVVENFEFEGLKVLLAARTAAIGAARDLAKEQLGDAAIRSEASAARVEKVDEEVEALLQEARDAAATERARVQSAAEGEASRIREGASRDMTAQVNRARGDLQRHVADLAVAIATGIVKNNLTGDDQDRLVRQYLERLGETVS